MVPSEIAREFEIGSRCICIISPAMFPIRDHDRMMVKDADEARPRRNDPDAPLCHGVLHSAVAPDKPTRLSLSFSLSRGGASFRRRPLLGLMRRAGSFLLCVPLQLPRDAACYTAYRISDEQRNLWLYRKTRAKFKDYRVIPRQFLLSSFLFCLLH